MRKITALLLIFVLVFSLIACSSDSGDKEAANESTETGKENTDINEKDDNSENENTSENGKGDSADNAEPPKTEEEENGKTDPTPEDDGTVDLPIDEFE